MYIVYKNIGKPSTPSLALFPSCKAYRCHLDVAMFIGNIVYHCGVSPVIRDASL